MLEQTRFENIVFLDIETVPQFMEFDELPDSYKKLWDDRSRYFRKDDEGPDSVYKRAGLYAEFGKIICISVGIIVQSGPIKKIRIKSYAGDDEKQILAQFTKMLAKFGVSRDLQLCAHNGKDFDFPYLARRILVHGMTLPHSLDLAGKKPWEVKLLDTMDLWKFGEFRHYTSLSLLCETLGIPNPKEDIDGSMVAGVYYAEKDLDRIVSYCEKDVLSVAQILLRLKGEPLITPQHVEIVKD